MTSVPKMRDETGTQGLIDLCNYIKENHKDPIKNIIEIGSYAGESSVVFAEQFPNANIICIDPWKSGYDDKDSASHSNFSEVEAAFDKRTFDYINIFKFKGTIDDFKNMPFFDNVDMVYIDGNHSYEGVSHDIKTCRRIPIICGHDFVPDEAVLRIHPHIEGVRKAVEELLGFPHKIFKDTSWIVIK